jgi:hypothetical protein
MLLDYLGQPASYERLLTLLRIGPYGTPRTNILRLESLGVRVTYREATLDILVDYLIAGQPVIAFVDTGHLPYWSESTNHAVVVAGSGEESVLLYDPAFNDPQAVPIREFELAWMECDGMCAVIER